MKQQQGNMWDLYDRDPNSVACILTCGALNARGENVMGRGCAREAKARFPGIAKLIGRGIRLQGNVARPLGLHRLFVFPTKAHWDMKSSIDLISRSAVELEKAAKAHPETTFLLPRPGCGNGELAWEDVYPHLAFLPDNVIAITF